MNHPTFHSATLALIRKRDGEVLLVKATQKNPINGRAVGFWDLPRTENMLEERSDQAAFRITKAYGFGLVESIQELAQCEIEENIRNITKTKVITLAVCDVDERSNHKTKDYAWSSAFIATKLLEEALMPPSFLGKILEIGMYTSHTKPIFDFEEAMLTPQETKEQIAPKIEP